LAIRAVSASTGDRVQLLPGGTTWQPRCGPMALELFIRRFLPGDPL
jgi:hypothetical protein